MITLTKLALLLHLFIETPASLSFLLAPRSQLPGASPEAVLILHNLGGLLASTNLVVLVLILSLSPGSATELLAGRLCLCLGTYHVWPIRRAWVRMRSSSISSHGKVWLGFCWKDD
ncbi:hypothetical protein VTI28DRAFT_10276 [Corynascus sepedonium]